MSVLSWLVRDSGLVRDWCEILPSQTPRTSSRMGSEPVGDGENSKSGYEVQRSLKERAVSASA